MTIQTNLNDRKELARKLIPFNHNEKLHYTGTPAFAYEGQGFRILRSGDINAMMKRQKPLSRLSCRKQAFFRSRSRQKEREPKCRKSDCSRMKRQDWKHCRRRKRSRI
ncbi:hypothetical protein [uncultured Megasphaera sp.]|uniref:hypothetical protein n=1 Tax=uncultured Megasphaera sp. TaxID=165188 RepID=UPI0025EA329F|nr:hypothetical protein [uncultured Megasphaera sp.]